MSQLPFPPPETPDDFRLWSVAEGARNPGNWIVDAEALMASAQLVLDGWRSARTAVFAAGSATEAADRMATHAELWAADVYMMLAGMALEDLLKAIIVVREPGVIQPRTDEPTTLIDPRITSGHDLVRLAERGNVPIDASMRATLARLSGFVQWAGRYPLAKKLEWMSTVGLAGDLQTVKDPHDPDAVSDAYQHLRAVARGVELEEYAPSHRQVEAERQLVYRRAAEKWLAETATVEELPDGTVRYVVTDPVKPHGACCISCSCRLQIELDHETVARTCCCPALHVVRLAFNGEDTPQPHTWHFREPRA